MNGLLRRGLSIVRAQQPALVNISSRILASSFHTTPKCNDLMEFFDDTKNFGEVEVKCGRAWTKDELRIKSNTDLHKLWYILLKERNMLMTMEHEHNDKMEAFANPERFDKVEISMENLENVVRERNQAYHLLETGEHGEVKAETKTNIFGLEVVEHQKEHLIPKDQQPFVEEVEINPRDKAEFLRKLKEKERNAKRKERNRNRNHVMRLMQRFPDLDRKALAAQYPDVDIEKLLAKDMCRGHYVPK